MCRMVSDLGQSVLLFLMLVLLKVFFLSIFVLGKEGLQCKGNVNTHGVISVYGLALFASSLNTAIFHRHLFSHQEAPAAPNY